MRKKLKACAREILLKSGFFLTSFLSEFEISVIILTHNNNNKNNNNHCCIAKKITHQQTQASSKR